MDFRHPRATETSNKRLTVAPRAAVLVDKEHHVVFQKFVQNEFVDKKKVGNKILQYESNCSLPERRSNRARCPLQVLAEVSWVSLNGLLYSWLGWKSVLSLPCSAKEKVRSYQSTALFTRTVHISIRMKWFKVHPLQFYRAHLHV